ncbi:hypothetical protein PspCFBP13528_10255 [Pseudomonas sp. CFBP13528]|uniref:Uncharacterized protein n=1 Tax=Pseudomonas fluorescens TaxID=294 RepID=A0A2N1E3T1_PSEFL|nr:hypothetical protein CIB54_16065 [Pseudomonas fluorescens]TKK32665.1 hypothetical protein PspCFBP13528_10255 [Pseudomonas sp. CFBP13528]
MLRRRIIVEYRANPESLQLPIPAVPISTKFIGLQQQFFLLDTSRLKAAKLPPLLDLPGQQ